MQGRKGRKGLGEEVAQSRWLWEFWDKKGGREAFEDLALHSRDLQVRARLLTFVAGRLIPETLVHAGDAENPIRIVEVRKTKDTSS